MHIKQMLTNAGSFWRGRNSRQQDLPPSYLVSSSTCYGGCCQFRTATENPSENQPAIPSIGCGLFIFFPFFLTQNKGRKNGERFFAPLFQPNDY